MPQTATQLKAGTPCWVDLNSSDIEASLSFYSDLFGWETEAAPGPPEETGNYTFFKAGGKMVAAVGRMQDPNIPTAWSTYIKTDDADETAEKVKQAGGGVIMEPFDVMDAGRMAIFTDSGGAVFSVWQAGTHAGAETFNVPGALSWNELNTGDAKGAKQFYPAVFGWDSADHEMGPMVYTEWQLDGAPIGGMPNIEGLPSGIPPHWAVYFAVDDCDATVAKTEQLGGKVIRPPMDIPVGRFAYLSDPQGAIFAVIKLAERSG